MRFLLTSRRYCWNSIRRYSSYDLDLKIQGVSLNKYVTNLERQHEHLLKNPKASKAKVAELQPVIDILNERKAIIDEIKNLEELLDEKEEGIRSLAEEEKASFENKIKIVDETLIDTILPSDEDDNISAIVLEVNTGVGGQEAMLFANELFDMYVNFAQYKGWEVQIAELASTDLGGIRHACALISGHLSFRYFKHEAGVHRVQRIPATEKGGRVHTSTVSVLALPQPSDIQVNLNSRDVKLETKRASGAGGQHVNTTDSAVRVVHIPTGLSVECQVDRSQIKNRQIAMTKLKALLYQQQLDKQTAKTEGMKKSQVRSNFRNEKVRTYNFSQDRVTDHRLQGANVHNLKGFMQGGPALETLIDKLDDQSRIDNLLKIVNSIENKK